MIPLIVLVLISIFIGYCIGSAHQARARQKGAEIIASIIEKVANEKDIRVFDEIVKIIREELVNR